jgi:hypothetical protein
MSRPKKNRKNQPTPASLRDQILADFATLRVPVTAEQLDEVLKQAQDAGWSHSLSAIGLLKEKKTFIAYMPALDLSQREAPSRIAPPLCPGQRLPQQAVPRLAPR